ncbi:hypothetical protein FZZ93_06175 [Halomonas eurihalina]|uniref:Uncharacterized protein n=1 Tax=Halomonas eurihalina TaxID=42566 RepID=A0A5D9DA45_HALER|nr:hypothetical protein [Halomonas eurihalina]MDR5859330.1 hypothetical protein [Halomonas eurihalina]TZG40627.1 hypothetical protein FZZ93_06175 [Halomonas eurihalina]
MAFAVLHHIEITAAGKRFVIPIRDPALGYKPRRFPDDPGAKGDGLSKLVTISQLQHRALTRPGMSSKHTPMP